MAPTVRRFVKEVATYWQSIIFIMLPLLLMIWPIMVPTPEVKTAFVLVIMSVFWTTEIIPLAVTSLFPVVFFPLLGVMKSSEVAPNYMKDVMFLFMGAMMVAIAIEKSNLHKRIALRMIMIVGGKVRWLMLGFMVPTWFFSMWMSNTAATSMMMPISMSVMEQLKSCEEEEMAFSHKHENLQMEDITVESNVNETLSPSESSTKDERHHKKMCKAMSLCVCYSASIGGIASLTGAPPNLVLKAQADLLFEAYGEDPGISFATWMVFGFPVSLLTLIVAWVWLQFWFLGMCTADDIPCSKKNKKNEEAAKGIVKKHYEALGPMRFEEVAVLICLIGLVLLWLTREPKFVDGWGYFFRPKYLSDATSSALMGCALFVIPSKKPKFFCSNSTDDDSDRHKGRQTLLDWETAVHKLPWGVVLLVGGGLALADACQKSGLSHTIGNQLSALGVLPPWAMVMIITLLTAAATEVTSNTATATLLLPIIGDMAVRLGVHPLYLMFPSCLAASFAFMLPAATPPNAVAFGFGHLKVLDMAMAGFPLNIICVLVVNLAVQTWGTAFFNLDVMPSAFLTANSTFLMGNTTNATNTSL